jgi:APA family basic amino acid/polyamine antiporter
MPQNKTYSPRTGIAVVIANMIGTGVFTSLGFQLLEIQSTFAILMLWLVGGITALCGALTYAELASRLPRSGGEYNFLSQLYHPCVGFVSGWVSSTVGFAAPTALAAMTFAAYFDAALGEQFTLHRPLAAAALVAFVSLIHSRNLSASAGLQNWFTLLKVILIMLFLLAIFFFSESGIPLDLIPKSTDSRTLASGAFAVSLIYVNYAYTGWNAATYITGELEDPQRNMPRVLIIGTSTVILLYLALNMSFLYAVPVEILQGKIEIGVIAAEYQFGKWGATLMGGVLSLLLISTVSAMLMAGPRVLQVMGQDFALFRRLSTLNAGGVPQLAILVQAAISLTFILTATFESVLVFSGFILGLSSLATVLGIFVLRHKKPESNRDTIGYRTWAYPLPPMVYSGIMLWTLCFIAATRPVEALVAALVIAIGIASYFLTTRVSRA